MKPVGQFILLLASILVFGELFGRASAATAELRKSNYSDQAVTNHLRQLRAKAPQGFTVIWQPPFAIASDLLPRFTSSIATGTVAWTTRQLRHEYFSNDPEEIVDIWLFANDASYRKHAKQLFGDTPDTPFGYYSPQHRALIMNISTGTGTLVHEMVHAFMPANFPDCPSWYNEGLASLYEQCGERGGRITGFPNWRLPKLQNAIRDKKVASFQKFTAQSSDEFYGRRSGSGYSEQYAQARYLCYYLQERGLLGRFHRQFVTSANKDRTGYESLKKVLNESDMQAFQKRWELFVLMIEPSR